MSIPRLAFVLAAGEGRRLLPFTASTPKPLLPLLNVPLLTHTLTALARAGVQRVLVNAWHRAEQVERHVAGLDLPGLEVEVVIEPELLGTGGGLANLADRAGTREPVLVLAGDIVADFDLPALAAAHARAGALATMALTRRADPRRFGPIEIDAQGCLTDIVGLVGRPGVEALVNASAHVLEPEFLDRLPREPSCLVRQGYVPVLAARRICGAYVHAGAWHEVGTAEGLLDAQVAALAGQLPVDRALAHQGGRRLGQDALVHPSAHLGPGVELAAGTVVGPGARVGRGARLQGCLLLPGARVPAGVRLVRRIVAPPPGGLGDDAGDEST